MRAGNDWLNVTFPVEQLAEVQQLVSGFLGAAERRDRGAKTYRESMAWETGCMLAWTEDRREAWLSMNGDSCDMIPPTAKLGFFGDLRRLGVKCTRVDVRLDVSRDLVSMDDVHAAAEAGNVVGFKRYDPRRSRDMFSGDLDEDQARFGSRGKNGGGTYYRVYDKALESEGEIDCIRFEAELSGDRAEEWFGLFCGAADTGDLLRLLGVCAISTIGFADRTGAHGHRRRFVPLAWWANLCALVGSALKLSTCRVRPTLETTVEWMKSSAPRALARLVHSLDCQGHNGAALLNSFVRALVKRGEKKLQFRPPPLLDQGFDLQRLYAV